MVARTSSMALWHVRMRRDVRLDAAGTLGVERVLGAGVARERPRGLGWEKPEGEGEWAGPKGRGDGPSPGREWAKPKRGEFKTEF